MTHSIPWPWRRNDAGQKSGDEPAAPGADAVSNARFGGVDEEPVDWVTVYNATALEEAGIIVGALESEGIPATLRYETMNRLYGSLAFGGVEVQVPRPLEDRARLVLTEDDSESDYDADDAGDADAPGGDTPNP